MTDVILRISGMDCGACAVRIVRALRGLPGLREVSVSDTAGCARLTYDEAAVDLGEIARCVQRAGFDVPVGMAERGELLTRGAEASAGQTARTVRRCGWLLLAYHAVCLPLAACGVIGPAAAAVLACGASGGVLLYALRRKATKGERP